MHTALDIRAVLALTLLCGSWGLAQVATKLALREQVGRGFAIAVLPAFLYQAIWVASVTYVAWFALIRQYPASLLSAFTFLTPFFGVAFGAAILNEPLTPFLLAALVLVAAGIYLVNRSAPPATAGG